MQKYHVKITRQAQEQLLEIRDYIQNTLLAPQSAAATLAALRSSIISLATMPGRIHLTDEDPWRSKGVRRMIIRNFYIYFWIDIKNLKVQVIAVTYARRDQVSFLKSLQDEEEK